MRTGRPKNNDPCLRRGCGERGAKRDLCPKHYQEWYRKYGHLRCEYDGCDNIMQGVRSNRTEGRRMSHGGGRAIRYCREHEWHHLAFSVEVYELNRERFALAIDAAGSAWATSVAVTQHEGCWFWSGRTTTDKTPYGTFVPEGGGDKHWMAHRVAYGLLAGGHKQGLVLDHLCSNSLCVNPTHLEPVKQGVNLKRRGSVSFTPRLENITPEVVRFAEEFQLPLPNYMGAMELAA